MTMGNGRSPRRLMLHAPRIFSAPLSPDEALGNVSALIGLPHVRAVSELDGFVDAHKHATMSAPQQSISNTLP